MHQRFVVMAAVMAANGPREYYRNCQGSSGDHIILTAGCAKYRYNKLDLGPSGIRVTDAGR